MLIVTVRLVGILHQVFKKKRVKLKFARPPKVKEIVEKLAAISPEARRSVLEIESNQFHPALLVLVNGKEISALSREETRVRNGDEVVLISVSHGG